MRSDVVEIQGVGQWRRNSAGKIGALNDAEVEAFLATDALARFACLKPDGAPYVIPLWYQWDGEDLWFVGRQKARWCDYVVKDPRVCVVIDAAHSPPDEQGQTAQIPKVFVEGKAVVAEAPNIGGKWVQVAEEMSLRYLGPNGPSYLVPTLNQPRWLIQGGRPRRCAPGRAWPGRDATGWKVPAVPATKRSIPEKGLLLPYW